MTNIALYIHNHHTVCFTVFNPPILYSLRSNKSDSVWLFSRGVCGFFINFIKRNFQKRQDINTHFTLPLSYTLLCWVYWPGVHIQQDFNLFSWSLIQVAVFIGQCIKDCPFSVGNLVSDFLGVNFCSWDFGKVLLEALGRAVQSTGLD